MIGPQSDVNVCFIGVVEHAIRNGVNVILSKIDFNGFGGWVAGHTRRDRSHVISRQINRKGSNRGVIKRIAHNIVDIVD